MANYIQILLGLVLVFLWLYYYLTSKFDFWKNLGIAGPKPKVAFGSLKATVLRKLSISELLNKYYTEYKHEPVFGLFLQRSPVLVVNDLDLIQDILIKDFSLFADRGLRIFKKAEPLSEHLFMLEPERWRPLRMRLSPIFTSGKLKDMFPLIIECSKHLEKYMDKVVAKGQPLECRDITSRFTIDVIGSCAFGIEMNALLNEDSEFQRIATQIFTMSTLQRSIRQFAPYFYDQFGKFFQRKDINNFFINMTMNTMKHRKENNIFRPDFINILMELRENPEKLENMQLTDELLTAQASVFFAAGFETSATTISHALYELAQHQEIQDQLRSEIKEYLANNNGVLKYDSLKEMKYLHMVFNETLRKYPVLAMLMRQSMENYTFNETKISIPKGTKIWIPVYPIHRDPDIYENPEMFNPERFNEDTVQKRHPMSFLAFGDGPRNCVGARFAHIQSKIGIITILRNYKVDVCEKTGIPYKPDPLQFLLRPENGVQLKITKLE